MLCAKVYELSSYLSEVWESSHWNLREMIDHHRRLHYHSLGTQSHSEEPHYQDQHTLLTKELIQKKKTCICLFCIRGCANHIHL